MATFAQAFAKARKEMGAGKTFTFEGKKYSTDRADDKKTGTKPKARPAAPAKVAAARPASKPVPTVAVAPPASKPTRPMARPAAPAKAPAKPVSAREAANAKRLAEAKAARARNRGGK